LPEEEVAEKAVEEAHVEEAPPEEAPTEARPKPVPKVFMVGSFEGARALVVVDEGKAYPMDDKADAFVREHNIPILPDYPEGVHVEGSDRAADLTALAKKLEAQT